MKERRARSGVSYDYLRIVNELTDLSQERLARRMHSSRGAVAAGQRDDRALTRTVGLRIEMVTGIDHRDLLNEDPHPRVCPRFLSVIELIEPSRTNCIYTKKDFQLFCALEARLPEIATKFGLCQFVLSTAVARVLLAAISLKETASYPSKLFNVSARLGKAIRQVALDHHLYKLTDKLLDHPIYWDKGKGIDECIYTSFEEILHGGTTSNPNPLMNICLLSLRGREFLKSYTAQLPKHADETVLLRPLSNPKAKRRKF